MKSLLFLLITATYSALATVVSDVITCRIEINSGARSTILSLPLTELGNPLGEVNLATAVLTDNLENGTFLFAADNGKTHAWRLTNKQWVKIEAVDGLSHTPDTAGITSFMRGTAFWIERAGDESALTKPFYIYGKVGSDLPGVQQITSAIQSDGKIVPAYTRIGNPNPEDRLFNDLQWQGCHKDDKIVLSSAISPLGFIEYSYNPAVGKWGAKEAYKAGKILKFNWNYDITLPAGAGFWYVRNTVGNARVSFQK